MKIWIAGQSFQEQFDFGMNLLKKYGTVTPTKAGWVFTPFKKRYIIMNDINNIILDFINASINNGKAQEDGNANQANKYYRVIEKRKKWLVDHNELGNASFLKLLNHENDYVKLHVSCALLHVNNKEAINTLSDLAKKKGILGFSAEMTISEYEKGHI